MANSVQVLGINVHVGDLVQVHHKIREGDKERIQVFEGLVLGTRGRGENKTFTVRKTAEGGIGVEKIWPVISPWLAKVEIRKTGQVRRAKIGYVRRQSARQVATITASTVGGPGA